MQPKSIYAEVEMNSNNKITLVVHVFFRDNNNRIKQYKINM